MNFLGIDISLNSTAVYIENSAQHILSFTNKKDYNKWIKELENHGVVFFHQHRETSTDYSQNEILKLKHYIQLSNLIISEIIKRIDTSVATICNIEGYSFSKNTSSILDIVSLSSLIRAELIKNINNIDITITSPSTLKLETCKLVYPPINVGKKKPKFEYRNNEGISGGSFKKPEMFKCMIDGNIQCPISKFLTLNKDLMTRDKIPNPIEDIIDSIFACKIKMVDFNI
jgi:hypothetical protein